MISSASSLQSPSPSSSASARRAMTRRSRATCVPSPTSSSRTTPTRRRTRPARSPTGPASPRSATTRPRSARRTATRSNYVLNTAGSAAGSAYCIVGVSARAPSSVGVRLLAGWPAAGRHACQWPGTRRLLGRIDLFRKSCLDRAVAGVFDPGHRAFRPCTAQSARQS